MAEPKMIKIASRMPMALQIRERMPDPEKPGLAPELRTAVIGGYAHPSATGESITEVEETMFDQWVQDNPNHQAVVNGLVRKVGDDEEEPAQSFGHEPGLEAWAKDGDNAKLAEQGTGEAEPGPVPAVEMNATSDAPNDDSPRSEVGPVPSARKGKATS